MRLVRGLTKGGGEPALDPLTIVAVAVLVYSLTLALHEGAHALTSLAAGGTPTLVSSTGTRGDWSMLGELDVLLVGVSGSAVNTLMALAGWLTLRRYLGRPSTGGVVAWLLFAVNGWVPAVYLVTSPLLGFGDWATIVAEFPNRGPLRASLTVTGLFICGLLWKETRASLARLVGNGSRADRGRRARRLVRLAWASGGAVALAASLVSPHELGRSVPIAVGSTLGATWPILPAAGRVGEQPVPGAPLNVPRSWPLVGIGALAGIVFVAVLGPGLRLGG